MKNKSLIIGGIVLSLMIVLSIGTYAYWTITRSQEGENTLIGGCLSIDISEEGEAISLDKAWPISDFEGMQLEGYTFKVTNDCEDPQDYRIDLDRLAEAATDKPMNGKYLAALLDYSVPVMYDDLETLETTEEGIKEKRVLAYDTVMGKSTNEHTLRLWIDEESPVSEQGSTFLSKVQINAGQGIEKYYTADNCFTFDSVNGSITAYDVSCGGTDVVIPYNINNVAVTQIGKNAFEEKDLTSVELPRSVTTLEVRAFFKNLNLEKIIFKDGLTSIGASAFGTLPTADNYAKLSFIMFPKTLNTIGASAFRSTSIKQIIIPDSVTSIGVSLFMYGKIENLIIGKGLTEISNHSFKHNEIREIEFPDNILKIGQSSFADNPIEEITFGAGITSIGTAAFGNEGQFSKYYNQNFLKNVYIPKNIINISQNAFENATSNVTIIVENPASAMTLGSSWSGSATVIFGEEPTTTTE